MGYLKKTLSLNDFLSQKNQDSLKSFEACQDVLFFRDFLTFGKKSCGKTLPKFVKISLFCNFSRQVGNIEEIFDFVPWKKNGSFKGTCFFSMGLFEKFLQYFPLVGKFRKKVKFWQIWAMFSHMIFFQMSKNGRKKTRLSQTCFFFGDSVFTKLFLESINFLTKNDDFLRKNANIKNS